jgi:2-(1,2-epoxy-1,2-dihydrophenyl)acetyl-CoA isomerase
MGPIPGVGGAYLLPRIVGMSKALEMFWSADWVDARDAERIGLVNRVFPDEHLVENTYAFARRVADGAPLAVQLIKRVIRFGLDTDLAI